MLGLCAGMPDDANMFVFELPLRHHTGNNSSPPMLPLCHRYLVSPPLLIRVVLYHEQPLSQNHTALYAGGAHSVGAIYRHSSNQGQNQIRARVSHPHTALPRTAQPQNAKRCQMRCTVAKVSRRAECISKFSYEIECTVNPRRQL